MPNRFKKCIFKPNKVNLKVNSKITKILEKLRFLSQHKPLLGRYLDLAMWRQSFPARDNFLIPLNVRGVTFTFEINKMLSVRSQ